MSLPEYYLTCSAADLSHRILHSMIDYGGSPAIVLRVDPTTSMKILTHKEGSFKELSVLRTDPGLNVLNLGAHSGLFVSNNQQLFRLMRVPYKGTVQGITITNAMCLKYTEGRVGDVFATGKSYRPAGIAQYSWSAADFCNKDHEYPAVCGYGDNYSCRYELIALLLSGDFHRMWAGDYGNPEHRLDKFMTQKSLAMPLSPCIHVERDAFDHAYVCYNGLRVGALFMPRVKYLPTKSYLADEVERTVGLRPL